MKYTGKDIAFMEDARGFAIRHSKDRSTKVGALVLGPENEPLSFGYNGFCRGVNDDVEERHQRPEKYLWSCHAESNAINNAARTGIRLLGSSMYVTTLAPCIDCTRSIIQAGIAKVFIEQCALDGSNPRSKVWMDNWEVSKEMFAECGVEVIVID